MEDSKKEEINVESWTILNGVLIEHKNEPLNQKWIPEDELLVANNIGIGSINPAYIEINKIQNKKDEYKKIKKFLSLYLKNILSEEKFQ